MAELLLEFNWGNFVGENDEREGVAGLDGCEECVLYAPCLFSAYLAVDGIAVFESVYSSEFHCVGVAFFGDDVNFVLEVFESTGFLPPFHKFVLFAIDDEMGDDVRGGGCGLNFFGESGRGPGEVVDPGTRVKFRRWRVVGGVVTEVIPDRDAIGVATYFLFNVGGERELDEAMIAV